MNLPSTFRQSSSIFPESSLQMTFKTDHLDRISHLQRYLYRYIDKKRNAKTLLDQLYFEGQIKMLQNEIEFLENLMESQYEN